MAWLAAVLSPRDVAPHENFSDHPVITPAGLLGLVVQGKFRTLRQHLEGFDGPGRRVVDLALEASQVGRVRAGAEGLRELVMVGELDDAACATAAGLTAVLAFAEVEDLDAGLAILGQLIPVLAVDPTGDSRLLEATLLQQRALRSAELGLDGLADSNRVLELLASIDVSSLSAFPTSESVDWGYRQSYKHIIDELRRSAQELLASNEGFDGDTGWRLLKEGPTTLGARASADAVRGYEAYIDELYEETLLSTVQRVSFEDRVDTGVWRSLVHAEYVANIGQCKAWRRRLGELRLLRVGSGPAEQQQDTLRLLRQAEDLQKFKLAVAHVRGTGPLTAVAGEARLVLRHRSRPERLRDVELVLLEHAAQVLTTDEAVQAFDLVSGALRAIELAEPVRGASPSIRVEHCWRALVALAPVAERVDEVAQAMLQMASQTGVGDALLDTAIARGAAQLDWSLVSPRVQMAWRSWATGLGSSANWSSLSSTVAPALSRGEQGVSIAPTTLDRIAQRLNSIMAGTGQDFSHEEHAMAASAVREALARGRDEAARGMHGFGGVSEAEVAAGLVLSGGPHGLSEELAAYLTDPIIWRRDKTAALERLARDPERVPADLARSLGRDIGPLLDQSDRDPFRQSAVQPFPSALRLAAALHLVPPEQLLANVVRLSGSDNARARLEAARTLAATLAHGTEEDPLWSVALALQLSRDPSPYVRSEAARALAQVATTSGEAHRLAVEHLLALLNEDGLLVPLLALRGLGESRAVLSRDLRVVIGRIAHSHPAFGVRLQAAALLESEGD